MTDEQIIKALEIHSNEKFDNCEGCPYLQGDSCEGFTKYSKPFRDVLNLINRQKAEIERLKPFEKKVLKSTLGNLKDTISADFVEVVRCKDCKHCDHCYPSKPKDGDAVEGWYCNLSRGWRKHDDFCSCGERGEK